MTEPDRMLRLREVSELCGLCRASIYNYMKAGIFPRAIAVGPRAVRWRLSEIEAYLASRPRSTGEAA